jgi:hypothetical protein
MRRFSFFVDNSTELAHFAAEAGKTYYFRTRLLLAVHRAHAHRQRPGRYLVNSVPRSTIKPKK